MDFPADNPERTHFHPHGGWPGNELEEALSASLGVPSAGARIVEVLGRSFVWVPLPNGGGPHSGPLDLPTMDLDGQAYVPVFSSEEQFRQVVGSHMGCTIAPAVEFARGLPPQAGLVVNPGGTVAVPLPPPAVAELCRTGRTPLDGGASGGRVRLFEPDWQDDPVDFLAAASQEFDALGVVATARRCLAAVETADPVLFVGVELLHWEGDPRALPLDALGRALGRSPARWPVNLVVLDVAQDPVADWLRAKVRPFYQRA
ncbi:enhanced serine sensitivity protein SseB [Streptomyces griseoincarnatus]|uniref:Enhanced serine sensitivity protein SseB n=4 Tax=Actinomycetes TaxID=1760 RepID=A0ABP6JIR5_9ACTN|nr:MULTISPECIES: enhanced serine sensitivity protein SseB [Streptomyces]MDH3036334.1 enhanced serine sensitivity protein SseB [Streptomyces sp. TRM75561]MQL63029.1 enhanced serine sensitivity protein SseB [Streptomyces vinaceus]GGP62743.1 enhanced serine sensitivity protein SseB [Streptomyces griseoincarnatus]GGT72861.1 enhanced serine sensitivity protein SseB [Streptomyces variabilis]